MQVDPHCRLFILLKPPVTRTSTHIEEDEHSIIHENFLFGAPIISSAASFFFIFVLLGLLLFVRNPPVGPFASCAPPPISAAWSTIL